MRVLKSRSVKRTSVIKQAIVRSFTALGILVAGPMIAPKNADAKTMQECVEPKTAIEMYWRAKHITIKIMAIENLQCSLSVMTPNQKSFYLLRDAIFKKSEQLRMVVLETIDLMPYKEDDRNLAGLLMGTIGVNLREELRTRCRPKSSSKAVEMIFDKADDNKYVKRLVDETGQNLFPCFLRSKKYPDEMKKQLWLMAVGSPKDEKKAVDAMEKHLEDKDEEIRKIAARALLSHQIYRNRRDNTVQISKSTIEKALKCISRKNRKLFREMMRVKTQEDFYEYEQIKGCPL